MRVRALMTHAHPDLDAIFAIYLLRTFGEEQFPGVKEAELRLVSADRLPEGKTAEDFEAEGILAVDTGGGRFDTHPVPGEKNQEKWDTCAAQLVAEALGVDKREEFRFLLPFTLAHDARGQSLTSKEATHHLMAPHGLIEGLHRAFEEDLDVVKAMTPAIEGIAAASIGTETPAAETADRFDRTLAEFLRRWDIGDGDHFRKEEVLWPSEGESHRVARDKNWQLRRDLEKLLKEAAWLLAGTDKAMPELEEERRVLLPAAFDGLAKLHGDGSEAYYEYALPLLAAAFHRESDWFHAIDEVERSAKVIRGRGVSVITIASKNGLTIKAARYRRGSNAVLYYEPSHGFVTLQSGQKQDGRPMLNLERIASRLRTAELVKRKGNGVKLPRTVRDIGLADGWFLHPSKRLLNCGSPKAPDIEPSALTWAEIIEMVQSDLRPEEKLPDWFCPENRCLEAKCTFYPLRLANCHAHRQRVRDIPKKGTLGDLFADRLKKQR